MTGFKGRPPGSGSGEMSRRTQLLRPAIQLTPHQAAQARKLRRQGHAPEQIAAALGLPLDEVEKALVQMRSPRPETTRGTLNVTLAAHRFITGERKGTEPMWQTMDRLIDELLRLRADTAKRNEASAERGRGRKQKDAAPAQDLLLPLALPEAPR
ncbi:MAG TPA: hypothetical protein VJ779_07350 [Acetobacteraceae bacterium]|nr:hypothetical protein [Acetobacteraceae bacterium]